MTEYDDLARELHAMRAEPRPEFARELDRRAAAWLRKKRGRTPFLHPLRIAIPAAAAAAAVVVALVVSGGGEDRTAQLEVAVVPDKGAVEALGGGGDAPAAAPDALQREAAPTATEGAFSVAQAKRVERGEPVVVRYFFSGSAKGTIEFAGRRTTVTVGPGSGRVEISTQGLPEGTHRLEIAFPSMPLSSERIVITDR